MSGPRNCTEPDYSVSNLTSSLTAPHNIRLEGGRFPHEGNIMVNGQPVCDDDFTLVNADVACKQLGYIGAVSFTKESRYGRTSPEFAMDQVRCDGTEERLLDCRHSKRDDCGAGEAAGAVCDTRTEEREQQDEQNCFQVGVGYNPGDWIGG